MCTPNFSENLDTISQSTAEILLLPVCETKLLRYWNSTSGFNFDLFSVPNFIQSEQRTEELWRHAIERFRDSALKLPTHVVTSTLHAQQMYFCGGNVQIFGFYFVRLTCLYNIQLPKVALLALGNLTFTFTCNYAINFYHNFNCKHYCGINHTIRTLFSIRRMIGELSVLCLPCIWGVTKAYYMGKSSAAGQPTRPTQPFILLGP